MHNFMQINVPVTWTVMFTRDTKAAFQLRLLISTYSLHTVTGLNRIYMQLNNTAPWLWGSRRWSISDSEHATVQCCDSRLVLSFLEYSVSGIGYVLLGHPVLSRSHHGAAFHGYIWPRACVEILLHSCLQDNVPQTDSWVVECPVWRSRLVWLRFTDPVGFLLI